MNQIIDRYEVGVEQGPDWLFVRLAPPVADRPRRGGDLNQGIWELAREHGAVRVLIELDRVDSIDETLLDGLAVLGERLARQGGFARVCGLAGDNLAFFETCRAAEHLPHFSCRREAVAAGRWEFATAARPR
jgi:hypothetical protein